MADKIFHTWFNQKTNPAWADKIMISDSQASNETKYSDLDSLPISTATQTALDWKVDNVIAWTNTTVSRNGNVITVNSLWWPAVVTDWFNRNYFVATEWQTEFTATFYFTENTWSVIVTLNWNVLKPTLDYTESWLNKVVFVSWLTAWDEVQLITGIKWDKGDTWNWISTIIRTSWDWSPWTTDTYTITFTDATTTTFQVYNWADWTWTVASVSSWTHITVDNTDPNNPIVNYDWELFSTTLKNKLDWIESGAEVNEVNEAPIDWEQYARKNWAWEVVIWWDPLSIVSDITWVTWADRVENIISLTKAEYDAITPDPNTIYNITDDNGWVCWWPQKLRITIPWELIADTSNYQWLYFKNESGASWTISNVAIAVWINASWTWAACAVNLYKSSWTEADWINTSATNLFTTAVDLWTSYSSLTNTPNTTTVEDGRWLSLRITSSAWATRRWSDMQVVITLA